MVEEARISESIVNLASERLGAALDKAFAECKAVIKLEAGAQMPKFFPNGIELIYGCIDIFEIVKIEVKIAGPEPKKAGLQGE